MCCLLSRTNCIALARFTAGKSTSEDRALLAQLKAREGGRLTRLGEALLELCRQAYAKKH
ncbi:hypothetical protein [Infirmifilum uzonense]|uniref:hypothetical protein n=1 Tax=Infirmifilum uzonense TaxID=1550241 RepID=UPI003C73EC4D